MTDLTKALAELCSVTEGPCMGQPWKTADFTSETTGEAFASVVATILNAALSGTMIPRADADLAVALMVEKAADIVGMCDQVGADAEGPVRALAPASALSELQELRDSDAESKGNLAHALHQLGQAKAELAALRAQVEKMTGDTFYIDCEFDGHNGPLLSIAMVRGDGRGLHVKIGDHNAVNDPWVRENVIPIMDSHHADLSWHVQPNEAGTQLRGFIGDCQNPKIIADSPVDIARFCRAISTAEDGGWHPSSYASMTLTARNVDCYPTKLEGAVQHNAWWDAMALRALLAELEAKA